MNKSKILVILALFVSTCGKAQNCNCMGEYRWARQIFEENDAGYSYYLNKYGQQAITDNNNKWEKAFINATDVWQCSDFLNAWIKFYRKGHIAVAMADQTKSRPVAAKEDAGGPKQNLVPRLEVDIDSFITATKSQQEATYEGIWTNEIYNIGVKKLHDEYIGFVISSKNEQWKAGEIKFSFPSAGNSAKNSFYYMGNHSLAQQQFDSCQLIGKNYFKAFDIYWKRMSPDFGTESKIDAAVALVSTPGFYCKKIDSLSTVFRIPSFENSYIPIIDSIVKSNHGLLVTTKNLIIDIRGNGGGADRCYDSITPYLYTNPIRTMWAAFFSTPLNNARYDWIMQLNGFSEKEKQNFKEMQIKLNGNMGKFVNLNESNQTFVMDTMQVRYQNPRQVAILIDGDNASTAEQFVLMAKQSKKVKLFGQRTAGALDFSNLNHVTSPSGNFKLFYATSRSYRIPKMAIDDYGIQPDYFIDESIPSYKWIEFVTDILNEN